jgi:tripartite-type tricarboxylate transporter receptor subunit TctC
MKIRCRGLTSRAKLATVTGLSATVAIAVSACASGAAPQALSTTASTNASASSAKVTPDLAFYKGKKITVIVGQPPGGAYYDDATILGPLIGSYLHATVNVVSIPQGDTLPAQDKVAASAPDGLTIGTMGIPTDTYDIIANRPGVNFNIQKQVFIGGNAWSVYVYAVSCTGASQTFGSWDELTSGKQSFQYLTTNGGGNEEFGQLLYGSYGLPVKMLTGYSTLTEAIAGCQRGDGAVGSAPVTSYTAQQFASGAIKPLLVSSAGPTDSQYYKYLKDVPTLAEWAAARPPQTAKQKEALSYLQTFFTPPGTNFTLFAPTGTPPARAAALTAALKYAMAQPQAEQKLRATGEPDQFVDPAGIDQAIAKLASLQNVAKQYLTYGT